MREILAQLAKYKEKLFTGDNTNEYIEKMTNRRIDQALTAIKQKILGKLPETKETDGLREAPNAWHWAEGFNACLAQVHKIIEGEL